MGKGEKKPIERAIVEMQNFVKETMADAIETATEIPEITYGSMRSSGGDALVAVVAIERWLEDNNRLLALGFAVSGTSARGCGESCDPRVASLRTFFDLGAKVSITLKNRIMRQE
ncbi:hypothetical protein C0995_005926 [Termitomyces sp. Mi166|nr:hypothetical protein C0995_005926 [Termitomyces sp. Mi166\